MVKDIRTICWEGSLDEFKYEKQEIIRHIKHIIIECEEEYEYHYAFWVAMDPDIDRGYEKFKFLMECGNVDMMIVTSEFAMQGAVMSKNWKIMLELREYIDINHFRDEMNIVYGYDTHEAGPYLNRVYTHGFRDPKLVHLYPYSIFSGLS